MSLMKDIRVLFQEFDFKRSQCSSSTKRFTTRRSIVCAPSSRTLYKDNLNRSSRSASTPKCARRVRRYTRGTCISLCLWSPMRIATSAFRSQDRMRSIKLFFARLEYLINIIYLPVYFFFLFIFYKRNTNNYIIQI